MVVGEDRYDAGCFAESRFGAQIHLLDDGFQHRGLARDFDIVLVTPDDARDRFSSPAGPRMGAFAFPAPRGCRSADQRRFAGIISPGGQDSVAGAAGYCAEKCSGAAGRFLRHCAAAEFSAAVAGGSIDPSPSVLSAIITPTPKKIFATCSQLSQRAPPAASLLRRKMRSIWAAYLAALAPLAVVPVKWNLPTQLTLWIPCCG